MSEESFSLDTALSFEKNKQAAIVGWVLRDKVFLAQSSKTIRQSWFSDPYVGKVFGAVIAVFDEFHRKPEVEEIKNYRPFTQEDAKSYQRLQAAIDNCIKMSEIYGVDLLRSEITDWMRAVIFAQGVQKAVTLYNGKKVVEAWKVVEDATILKSTASFEEGVNQGFAPSEERVDVERRERIEQSTRILKYGVSFLDDALGGIIPNDLIVLGAKTGAGKTQLATSIALHNAQSGHPVHYFALEAEENEIERRIKYGIISSAYYKHSPNDEKNVPISYVDWRLGKIDDILGPIEEMCEAKIKKALKNLHTLYRTSGSFDLNALEKNLLSVVSESRLIIIDHLHYVDTDDDENASYKKTIKLIRDIVLRFGVPIIVIAHLRKNQGGLKNAPLINTIEDFHGTSDVPKIATTCIMISPAVDHSPPEDPETQKIKNWLWPTYMGVVKSRLDGSRTRLTALGFFDSRKTVYDPAYRLGRMISLNQEWEELAPSQLPKWAGTNQEILTTHRLG